jgi:hypothetical protein
LPPFFFNHINRYLDAAGDALAADDPETVAIGVVVAVTRGVGVGVGCKVTSTVVIGVGEGADGLHATNTTVNNKTTATTKMSLLFIKTFASF